jgi:hypothetical protein
MPARKIPSRTRMPVNALILVSRLPVVIAIIVLALITVAGVFLYRNQPRKT